MDITQAVADVQNTVLEQVVSVQNKIVELNRDLADKVGKFGEGMPSIPGLPAMPAMPSIPGMPALPGMEDAIEANRAVMDNLFSWSTKLIDVQRGFTTELLSIWAPVVAKAAPAE